MASQKRSKVSGRVGRWCPTFIWFFFLLIILIPTDSLIALVEVLGSHSIQAAELKQLIGALRPLENRRVVGSTFTLTPSLV